MVNTKNTPFFIFDFLGLKSPAGMPDQYYIEISGYFSVSVSYANFGVFAPKSDKAKLWVIPLPEMSTFR